MAGRVSEDHVEAPLNISHPAPQINLQGFKWDRLDKKIPGTASIEKSHADDRVTASNAAAPVIPRPPSPAQQQLLTQLTEAPPGCPLFPLAQFQGAFAGNGFNLIFRPRPDDVVPLSGPPEGPTDNLLELNLTTEQLTFGKTIGEIPNRGSGKQPDIFLGGFPYLQTVQDCTNLDTGKADKLQPTGIHFETGVWLNVPKSDVTPHMEASVVRMGSVPHGTTIHAQGLSPQKGQSTVLGGIAGAPKYDPLDTTPFSVGNPIDRKAKCFQSMDATKKHILRIPEDLTKFIAAGTITTDIIKNPNLVLERAIQGLDIRETISFTVSTEPSVSKMNGGGTANISFLAGQQAHTNQVPKDGDDPNAHAALMTSTYWIETVAYSVIVPSLTTSTPIELKPNMPENTTAPTPKFKIIPPSKLPTKQQKIEVMGIQIQSSQIVNLNFGRGRGFLTWPHVSVSTLVPTAAQEFKMPDQQA